MNFPGLLIFSPCHDIIRSALLNKKWAYTRDLATITNLPKHVVQIALAQMINADLVEHDPVLNRFKLKSPHPKNTKPGAVP